MASDVAAVWAGLMLHWPWKGRGCMDGEAKLFMDDVAGYDPVAGTFVWLMLP